jgi:hypothetical protein
MDWEDMLVVVAVVGVAVVVFLGGLETLPCTGILVFVPVVEVTGIAVVTDEDCGNKQKDSFSEDGNTMDSSSPIIVSSDETFCGRCRWSPSSDASVAAAVVVETCANATTVPSISTKEGCSLTHLVDRLSTLTGVIVIQKFSCCWWCSLRGEDVW